MQTLSKFVIIVRFEINREYIAKNLCIKKEEANNCCKGACHLNEKLEEEDKKEQKSPMQNLNKEVKLQLISQVISFNFNVPIKEQKHFTPYKFPITFHEPTSLFQPPDFSV